MNTYKIQALRYVEALSEHSDNPYATQSPTLPWETEEFLVWSLRAAAVMALRQQIPSLLESWRSSPYSVRREIIQNATALLRVVADDTVLTSETRRK